MRALEHTDTWKINLLSKCSAYNILKSEYIKHVPSRNVHRISKVGTRTAIIIENTFRMQILSTSS